MSGWGLVLGGGGLLGGAWLVGALTAFEQATGRDARDAAAVVGTSVGALYGGLLAAGAPVSDLLAHQLGRPPVAGPLAGVRWDYDTDVVAAGAPVLQRRPGSTRLITGNVRRLRELPPTTVASALVPLGRGSLERVGELMTDVAGPGWPRRDGLRVVAVDYAGGDRVVFTGPGGGPAQLRARVDTEASLGTAVMASCAVPGWFPPVVVGGRPHVDGGVWSSTNADLLRDDGLDEVYVLAPMVSFAPPPARSVRDAVDRQWRQSVTRRCMREVAALHAAGSRVTVLGPGERDLEVVGHDLMDARRRLAVLQTSIRTSREALRSPGRVGTGPAMSPS